MLETGIEIEKSASIVTRSFFQAFIITYSFISSMYMVNKKMPYVDPVENRKNAEKCVGENASPMSSSFLNVFFDVDSDTKKIFEFGQSGAKI